MGCRARLTGTDQFTVLMGGGNGMVPQFTGGWEEVFDYLDGECAKVGAPSVFRPAFDAERAPDKYASGVVESTAMAYPVYWRVRAARHP